MLCLFNRRSLAALQRSRPCATSRSITSSSAFLPSWDSTVAGLQMIREIPEMDGPNCVLAAAFGHKQHFAELDHSRKRRAPFSKQSKVVDKPTQRLVNLIESSNHDHQLAKGMPAAEIRGRGDDDRS